MTDGIKLTWDQSKAISERAGDLQDDIADLLAAAGLPRTDAEAQAEHAVDAAFTAIEAYLATIEPVGYMEEDAIDDPPDGPEPDDVCPADWPMVLGEGPRW